MDGPKEQFLQFCKTIPYNQEGIHKKDKTAKATPEAAFASQRLGAATNG